MLNKSQQIEKELVDEFKKLVSDQPGKNFVKPLSEFWNGCKPKDTPVWGCYGIWFGTEGGTIMKDGTYPCEYYNEWIHPNILEFLEKYKNLIYFDWYDSATTMIIIEK